MEETASAKALRQNETWHVKEAGRNLERPKSTEWEWGVDGMRVKMQVGWDQITQDSKCIVKPQRCFELGGGGWDNLLMEAF